MTFLKNIFGTSRDFSQIFTDVLKKIDPPPLNFPYPLPSTLLDFWLGSSLFEPEVGQMHLQTFLASGRKPKKPFLITPLWVMPLTLITRLSIWKVWCFRAKVLSYSSNKLLTNTCKLIIYFNQRSFACLPSIRVLFIY